jgi:hypothetical protein
MHPILIIKWKNAIGPFDLKRVDQFLQHSHGPGDEKVSSQRLQICLVLLIVFCDEVVDAYGRVTVSHIKSTACTKTNKQLKEQQLDIPKAPHSPLHSQ